MIEYDKYAVGSTIRRIRKEKKLSQEVLSGLAGIARSHIAMIESGAKQANFETLWKISLALSMPPHVLVEEIEKNARQENKQDISSNGEK